MPKGEDMKYTKEELLNYFHSQYALAKFLKIRPQAVYAWPMEEPVPELRRLQLEKRRGEWPKRLSASALAQRERAR